MMNPVIKKYVDNGDLKSLKYVFVDALDVDPTFVKYEEDYNYCKSIPGLLEKHEELTPLTDDESRWTDSYWTSLKMDLVKNFSDERMTHMRKVAKVFMADKVQRILAERAAATVKPQVVEPVAAKEPVSNEPAVFQQLEQRPAVEKNNQVISKAEQQEREKEALKKEIEAHNKAVMEEQNRKAQERAEQQRKMEQEEIRQAGAGISKKAIGIAVAAVAVAAVVLIVLLK